MMKCRLAYNTALTAMNTPMSPERATYISAGCNPARIDAINVSIYDAMK